MTTYNVQTNTRERHTYVRFILPYHTT